MKQQKATNTPSNKELSSFTYQLNDQPPFLPLLVYGMQWLLVSLPTILIIGAIVTQFHYDSLPDQIFYLQKLFAIIGITFLLQVLFGHRLPIVCGPASVLLIGILASDGANRSEIYTAVIVGGVLLLLCSYLPKLFRQLSKIFTDRIVIVILALIAFTLMPSIIRLIFDTPLSPLSSLYFSLLALFLLVLSQVLLKGIWKSTVVLWGLLIGSIVYFLLSQTALPSSTLQGPSECSFFIFPLKFNIGIVLSFLFCYVALFINEIGSIQGLAHTIGQKEVEQSSRRGLKMIGLANIFSGVCGVIGVVDFSYSSGVVVASSCASRYTLLPAGFALLLLAFCPSILSLCLQLPLPVMGFILLYLMVMQLSAALQMIPSKQAIDSFDDSLTIALPILVAIFIAFLPESVSNAIPTLLKPIHANAFVMGVISVLVLEHLFFRKKRSSKNL